MIELIQYCLLFLFCVTCWCEYTKFFTNKWRSVVFRLFSATTLIGLAYKTPMLISLPYDWIFAIMLCVVIFTFLIAHLILKRYEHNKFRKMRAIHRRSNKGEENGITTN